MRTTPAPTNAGGSLRRAAGPEGTPSPCTRTFPVCLLSRQANDSGYGPGIAIDEKELNRRRVAPGGIQYFAIVRCGLLREGTRTPLPVPAVCASIAHALRSPKQAKRVLAVAIRTV